MNQEKPTTERPAIASGKVPLWIKVMWFLGVTWMLAYVFYGLRHLPREW